MKLLFQSFSNTSSYSFSMNKHGFNFNITIMLHNIILYYIVPSANNHFEYIKIKNFCGNKRKHEIRKNQY